MGTNPSAFKWRNNPVDGVTWNDTQKFIERLHSESRRKYRLPTEAESVEAGGEGDNKGRGA